MICSKHSRELIRFAFGTILSLLLACSGGGGGGGGQQQPPPPPSAPTISSVQPTSGAPGIAVTIQGTNLDTVTSVAFGGVAASLGAHTATQLSTTVPSGASSGSISVTGPGGTAVSSTVFTVLPPAPTLTGFTPASGPVGTVVTLSGANLSGATSVAFGGISAAFTIASSAQINTSVPAGASTGPVGVTTPGGTANSPASFTVTVPAPIPPTITTQPQNQSVTAGASALFTVTATATPAADPLTYQWKVNKGGGFTNVSAGDGAGGATASFTTIAATVPMSGYLYECTVTDVTNGLSTTSASGILTVNSSRWLSMYYPSYQQFLMPPAEIDYTAMTHLIHWPVLPKPDGTLDTATTDFTLAHSQDVVARAHAAGVKVLLGIGGNQDSGATVGFQGATSVANRAIFIANIVGLMQARGYDGVDINWEVIRNIDAPQFTAFIQDLRAALNPIMPRPLLTLPPDSGSDFVPALIASVQQHLDQINIQTYVMSGAYPGWVTWFNSPVQNGGFTFPSAPAEKVPSIDDLVNRFTGAGIDPSKLAIGIQFDGFVWAGGSGTDTGGVTKPRQSWDRSASKPDGSDIGAPNVTTMRYADIVTSLTPAQGYQAFFDAVALVPWLGRDLPGGADDRFVSYDDEEAIRQKALYVRAKGLSGVFIFEVSGDYFPARPAGQRHPLMSAAKVYIKDGFVNGLP